VPRRLVSFALLAAATASAALIGDVRESIAANNFGRAEAYIQAYRAQHGVTPELIEALSWIARGRLDRKECDLAEKYARQTYDLATKQLGKGSLDQDRYLPIALGAAIEVQAQAMAAQGERAQAVKYLRGELSKYASTSIRTRIQKNINLLSLEGRPAPAIQASEFLGPRPPALAALRGKPVLLFFWAHWCSDCKAEVAVLQRLLSAYGDRMVLIGPTQRYGYTAGGEEASPQAELQYIDAVRRQYYASLANMPVPVSAEAFRTYGVSTTPTLVILDRAGIVRLYHPGAMTYEELKRAVDRILARRATT
jgi:thiol-disulfide isomerase/thioredoxin